MTGEEGDLPELAGHRLLQVYGHQMAPACLHIVLHAGAVGRGGVGQVAHVGVDTQIGAANLVDIDHALGHGVHKLRLHGLKAQDHPVDRRHGHGGLQIFRKVPPGLL